ncbi:MAG TPA: hypothetical protein VIK65_01130 [Candidatus Limnocylindrales bacterium]|jgi:hypothetical protein
MGFLRRLLGGGPPATESAEPPAGRQEPWTNDDERGHELELARFEQSRTTDLMRRQQQYADRSWTPPAQGGTKRAGDEEADA